jgi:LuxR family transcriptional regulator, maltose regulon positive regulatory protein
MRVAEAVLRLAQRDPAAASVPLVPVLDGSVSTLSRTWLAQAFLLEAIARDALSDEHAAGRGDGAGAGLCRA